MIEDCNIKLPGATKDLIVDKITSVGADSGTVFVQDPWFPGEARVVFMYGVKHPEPMFGFLFPSTARALIEDKGKQVTLIRITSATNPEDENEKALKKLSSCNRLFGGFAEREGIQSSIRLSSHDHNGARVVMFLNFTRSIESIPATLERELTDFINDFDNCFFDIITNVLQKEDPAPLKNTLRILQIVQNEENDDISVEGNLRRVLRWAEAIVQRRADEVVASIYSFDQERRALKLIETERDFDRTIAKEIKEISIDRGENLIALVALRRSELLVTDLNSSAYATVPKPPIQATRSILCIPILSSGDNLVGVLNLESPHPNIFTPLMLRAVWCAANLGSAAYRPAEMMQKLLHICGDIQQRPEKARPLDDLAELARKHQRAHMCFIWRFNPELKTFIPLGISTGSNNHNATPRTGSSGWSNFVLKGLEPVLITNITANSFDAYRWCSKSWQWMTVDKSQSPPTLHELTIKHGIAEQLGVPIYDGDNCIGVVWFKFKSVRQPKRGKEAMGALVGIASEIAMLLVGLHRTEELKLRSVNEGMRSLMRSLQHDVVGKIAGRLYTQMDDLPVPAEAEFVQVPTKDLLDWKLLLDLQRSLVSHLISVAENQTSKLKAATKRVRLRDVVDKAIFVTTLLQKRPLCQTQIAEEIFVKADANLLVLTLMNLIQNSKKATSSDRSGTQNIIITADVHLNPLPDGKVHGVKIVVEDGGRKFPPEIKHKLYNQAGQALNGGAPGSGSGYGLYLCSQFVKAHGGEMHEPVDNERGGTTISFFLPN